jgi:hypothetical protein
MLATLVLIPMLLGVAAVVGAAIEYRIALRTAVEPFRVTCPEDGDVTEVRIDPRVAVTGF